MADIPTPKTVAILETRTGAHLAELIARHGCGAAARAGAGRGARRRSGRGRVRSCRTGRAPVPMMIFQTGVGTRALFQVTDALGSTAQLLAPARTGDGRRARAEAHRASSMRAVCASTSAPLRPSPARPCWRRSPRVPSQGARVRRAALRRGKSPAVRGADGARRRGAGDRDLSLGASRGYRSARAVDRCARALGAWMRWCSRARCR